MVSVFFANSAIVCLLMVLVSLLSVVVVINSNHSVHVLDPKDKNVMELQSIPNASFGSEDALFPNSPCYIITANDENSLEKLFGEMRNIGRIERFPSCRGEWPCIVYTFGNKGTKVAMRLNSHWFDFIRKSTWVIALTQFH
jgi:hypothetical protein